MLAECALDFRGNFALFRSGIARNETVLLPVRRLITKTLLPMTADRLGVAALPFEIRQI